MGATDIFLLIVRWIHLVSAAAWVGGSLFYLLVLRPTLKRNPESAGPVNAAAAAEFRSVVDTCIVVLLATGVILTVTRLTPGVAGLDYVIALAVKITLSLAMFWIVWSRRKRPRIADASSDAPPSRLQRTMRAISGYNALVILGLVVFLLADLLKVLYEMALAGS